MSEVEEYLKAISEIDKNLCRPVLKKAKAKKGEKGASGYFVQLSGRKLYLHIEPPKVEVYRVIPKSREAPEHLERKPPYGGVYIDPDVSWEFYRGELLQIITSAFSHCDGE